MRDPKRLCELSYEIQKGHEKFPDWRFMQFMLNFFSWHMTVYKTDGFYVEDKDFLKRFEEFISECSH